MYTKHFGFKEKPFNPVPNPSYLFLSSKHANALTFLEYGLAENAGFVMLTGSFSLRDIVMAQEDGWYCFSQILGLYVFLIAALIAVVIILAVTAAGGAVRDVFQRIADSLTAALT